MHDLAGHHAGLLKFTVGPASYCPHGPPGEPWAAAAEMEAAPAAQLAVKHAKRQLAFVNVGMAFPLLMLVELKCSASRLAIYRSITHANETHASITLWPIPRGPYVVALVPDDQSKPALNETTRMFGERVRNRRAELGLSQEAAALRCGIHWTQLGKVERGQRSLRLETIVRIANGLGINAGDLVSGLPLPPEGRH